MSSNQELVFIYESGVFNDCSQLSSVRFLNDICHNGPMYLYISTLENVEHVPVTVVVGGLSRMC